MSQEMFSSTIFLLGSDGTSVLLCVLGLQFFLLVLYFEFWDDKQNSVTYVWKVIITYVPIEGKVVNSCVDGSFDSPFKVCPSLPTIFKSSTDML